MGFLSKIKQKFALSKQQSAYDEACRRIAIRDFEGELYIAYDNFPVIAAESWWSSEIIIEQLSKLRNQYLRYTGNIIKEEETIETIEENE